MHGINGSILHNQVQRSFHFCFFFFWGWAVQPCLNFFFRSDSFCRLYLIFFLSGLYMEILNIYVTSALIVHIDDMQVQCVMCLALSGFEKLKVK